MSELARTRKSKRTLSSPESNRRWKKQSAPLPDELITEILVRLPVKPLVRFRIVSKSWYALIRSPYFVNQHAKHDHKGTILFLNRISSHPREEYGSVLSLHDPDSSDFRRLSPTFPVPYFVEPDCLCPDIVGTCNGLFFLSHGDTSMLCNPALQEFKVLPPRPSHLCRYDVYNQGRGFGFDPLTGSYKVIRIYNITCGFPKVELFDSRSNCWRMIDSADKLLRYVHGSYGIFFKGACHWKTRYTYLSQHVGVICFDVSTEVFRHFQFPKWDYGYYYEKDYRLSISRDRLTLVCYMRPCSCSPSSTSIDIWVMEEYGVEESWAQAFKIELNSRIRDVSFFWNDEWILVEDVNGELGRALTLHGLRPFWWAAAVFKETLISLDDVISNPI